MTKTELVEALAEKSNVPKSHAAAVLDAFINTVTDTVAAGDKIQLTGFGTFERVQRSARTGKNPRTGETLEIPASYGVHFKAGSLLKSAVNS